jgi:uncharacterized membrane protein
MPRMKPAHLQITAIASLTALIFLCLAWELWLAPLRPGGSFLALKALPLLAPLFGILRGRVYTYQWSSLLILAWFTEGIVRAWSDHGLSQHLAQIEIALSVIFFLSAIFYVRQSRQARRSPISREKTAR